MPVQCPKHPHAIVSIDEGFPCPVCFLLDSQREQIDALLATEAGLRHTLANVRYMATAMVTEVDATGSIEAVRPTGEVRVTITTDPEPAAGPDPSIGDVIVHRVTTEPTSRPQAEELICALADTHGIRAVKTAYRWHVGEPANRSWSAADLASAWADRLFPATAEPEATAEAEPIVEPGPTVEQEEATGEEEPAARLTESEYIAELRLRFTDRTTLAKVYRDLIGYSPPPNMEPVEMRAVMAADQWSKGLLRGPIDDVDAGPAEDLDRADQDAPPGDPPPADEIPF